MTFDPRGLCAICKERGTDTITLYKGGDIFDGRCAYMVELCRECQADILPAVAELIANAKKDRSS